MRISQLAAVALLLGLTACGSGIAGVLGLAGSGSSSAVDQELFVLSVAPIANSTGIERDQPIVVQFSVAVDPGSITEETFRVTTGTGPDVRSVPGQFIVASGQQVHYVPDEGWPLKSTITLALTPGLRSSSGKQLSTVFGSQFEVRDGELREVSPPALNGRCADLEALPGGQILALIHRTVDDELDVFEWDPASRVWIAAPDLLSSPVSAIQSLEHLSHTDGVSIDSLATSEQGQAILVTSVRVDSGTAIVARLRSAPGVWGPVEVVAPAQSEHEFTQVQCVFRGEQPNVLWNQGSIRSRRRENGEWQPVETVIPSGSGPRIDLASSQNGTLHAVWETPFGAGHKSKAPGESEWPAGGGFNAGLAGAPRSLQLHAFADGSALLAATALFLNGGASVQTSFLFPDGPLWSSLGDSASLNPLLGGDGSFINLLVASHPSGRAIAAMALDVETRLTIGANAFSPVQWRFGDLVAGPDSLGGIGTSQNPDIACAVDAIGNGIVLAVDLVNDRLVGHVYSAQRETWSPLDAIPAPSGTGCATAPRLIRVGDSGEFFGIVNFDCLAEPMVALRFQ